MKSKVLLSPVVEKVIRDRTFDIVQLRSDRGDMLGQLISLVNNLLDEKFNGSIVLDISNGGVSHVQAHEISKVGPRRF